MRARKKLSLVQWASESSAFLVQLYSTCPLGELKRIERTSVLYRLSRKKVQRNYVFPKCLLVERTSKYEPCPTAHWKNWTSP